MQPGLEVQGSSVDAKPDCFVHVGQTRGWETLHCPLAPAWGTVGSNKEAVLFISLPGARGKPQGIATRQRSVCVCKRKYLLLR